MHHLWRKSIPGLGGLDSKEVFPYVQPKMVLEEFVTVGSCHPLGRSGEQMFPPDPDAHPDVLIGSISDLNWEC